MQRRTKIVATLGPATQSPEAIEGLVLAGVDVVRLNFSHGSAEEHVARADLVREMARKHGRFVAVLADLQGPKIRIARFAAGKVQLRKGQVFVLDAGLDKHAGDENAVGIDYEALISDSRPDDILLLDDGRIELKVLRVEGGKLFCEVLVGGPLSNNKGINRKGGGLSASALTEKDCADIHTAAAMQVDYLAVSFPRDAADMQQARRLLREAGGEAGLIAKIERAETVGDPRVLDAIIEASEGVMVARGDLGVEIGDAELVAVQKLIIERARTLNRIVITATQMMESMITQSMPTRAEVFDVANAVLDGTDAVMLSAETAAGAYPIETVEAMRRVIVGAEKHPQTHRSKHRMDEVFHKIDESIAMAAMYAANHLHGVKAIICMTESGDTPRLMSRIRSHLPIYAFSRNPRTQNRVTLFRGVQTIPFDCDSFPVDEVNARAVDELVRRGVVEAGDHLLISRGDYANAQGGTNCLRVVRVGDAIC
ncbi:pyruvate kinase [Pseudomonas lalucatii]|uniref:Pyruvate kinase n=1 Tax=Pseudomonas lalucatii TaxID=1424203 RepID=A0ABS5PWJ8_9PSED|nr:pyruvate kinase [Pseudomonas lalucatii]MBS7660872.1 pyruvate kinase [Pseudomonas lalucatii]MBS7724402.1 pyruvate kinase [Pseudomonas lalucatii]QVM87610.1 pyruvate kinase [Pseudomonas lalucatii]